MDPHLDPFCKKQILMTWTSKIWPRTTRKLAADSYCILKDSGRCSVVKDHIPPIQKHGACAGSGCAKKWIHGVAAGVIKGEGANSGEG